MYWSVNSNTCAYAERMAARADVTPNRRGVKSRELVLDAAERVMAEHGFEAATLARVVDEAGIPMSSVYHYFGSKDGILLAVMERGADRFFADLPDLDRRPGRPGAAPGPGRVGRRPHARAPPELPAPADRLRRAAARRAATARYRLWSAGSAGTRSSCCGSRSRSRSATTRDSPATDRLARFALAAIDGAFVASQADRGATLEQLLEPLAPALVAARRALLAKAD